MLRYNITQSCIAVCRAPSMTQFVRAGATATHPAACLPATSSVDVYPISFCLIIITSILNMISAF